MNNEVNNVEKNRSFKLSEVVFLLLIIFIVGFILGLSVIKSSFKTCEDYSEFSKFIETYNYIVDNYYDDLDKEKLLSSAIEGMLNSIDDPYTTFIDEDNSNVFNTTLEGSFEGIGVEIVSDSNNNVVVYRVIEDSPAYKAGIKSLDIIKSIDGVSMEGLTPNDFVTAVKNSSSEIVKLSVLRGSETINFDVKREIVTIKSVSSEIFEINGKKIGYLYISIFANNTYGQFKSLLMELEDKGIDSLIIDVRGNSGGHLTSVENILGLFLDSSHVIYQTEDRNGVSKFYSRGNITKSYPISILINEGSASASEILAAALKEEYGASIIGKKSFGKGTVQELKTLDDDIQYKFTTKKWLTPKGNWVNEVGVPVDVEVEFNRDYYDNPIHENDDQLQAAIKHMLEK